MNRTRARKSAVRRRTSLSAKGSDAATDEAPLQAFERGLFQQDQGVANIVSIGFGMSRENLFDAGRQPKCPASGLRRAGCWMALSHVDGGRLTSRRRVVTAVPKEHIDRRLHRCAYFGERRPEEFELSSGRNRASGASDQENSEGTGLFEHPG
jgi:hypothetical protein